MKNEVEFDKYFPLWTNDNKWGGLFEIEWVFIKDVPFYKFKEIMIEMNDGITRSVSFSRDSQEIPFEEGKQIMEIYEIFSSTNTITKNSYHLYGIDYVLNLINTTTQVEVDNHIVDVKEVPYVALYIPKMITEGNRHSTLYSMIHHLFYLNPELEIDIIYSYVWFVNNVFVRPKLDKCDVLRHFNNVVNQIHSSSLVYVNYRKRRIHFNKNCWYLTSNDKMILAKKLTGVYKRHHNKQRVNDAIQKLENEKKKITNVAIKQITGMDVKTIRNHRKSSDIDLELEISSIIEEFSSFNPTQLSA